MAPLHDDGYGEPEAGLELVAVVEQVGCSVRDEALSPFLKPK